MRALCFCILALILAAPTSWAGKKEGKKGGKVAVNPELVQQFDTDSDGQLSKTETKAAQKAMNKGDAKLLELFDADKDGKLKGKERAAARRALGIKGKTKKKQADDDDDDDDDHDDDDDDDD